MPSALRLLTSIRLDYPFLPFLANFAANIADPYITGEFPIGAGPFMITSYEKNKKISLIANDFYYEGRPAVDELGFIIIDDPQIGYELFKNGTLSIYHPNSESIKKIKIESPELLYSIPEFSVQFININCQKSPFNNKLVRQAINYAIDKEKMVEYFLKDMAIPARGIFPPSMRVYNRRLKGYEYNPEKSKLLLREAGFEDWLPDIYPMDVSDSPSSIKRGEFVREALAKVGIKIELNPLPWHILIEKSYKGNSIISFQGWISDNGDPDNFLYPLFHTRSFGYAGNTFFFSHPEIDRMIEEGRRIRNFNQRINFYQELEEKILDEAPGVFLYHSLENIAIQRNILGMKPHPLSLIRLKYISTLGEDLIEKVVLNDESVRVYEDAVIENRKNPGRLYVKHLEVF